MTLTKSLINDVIAEQNGFTHKKSTETTETTLELLKSELTPGDDVLINGFGKFCAKKNGSRKEGIPLPVGI